MDLTLLKLFLDLGSFGLVTWLYVTSTKTHREEMKSKDEYLKEKDGHIRAINEKVRDAFIEHARTTQVMADAIKSNTQAVQNNTETIKLLLTRIKGGKHETGL